MAMASPPPSMSHHLHHHRRESSRGSPGSSEHRSSSRRPRLLRACATEPSITTSSPCKAVLTSPSPNASTRASELLNRVAISNAAVLGSSPNSTRSFETSGLTEAEKRELLRGDSGPYSACYFSFPSFDAWEPEHPDDEDKGSS